MGLIRKMIYKQYVIDSQFHEFTYYFLFWDTLFCISFFILYKENFGFKTELDNILIHVDKNGIKYYLSHFLKCKQIPLKKAKSFVISKINEMKQKILYAKELLEFSAQDIHNKQVEEIAFEKLEHSIKRKNFFFK
jgi:hypothetical protein